MKNVQGLGISKMAMTKKKMTTSIRPRQVRRRRRRTRVSLWPHAWNDVGAVANSNNPLALAGHVVDDDNSLPHGPWTLTTPGSIAEP
jgi:hypothetical protein